MDSLRSFLLLTNDFNTGGFNENTFGLFGQIFEQIQNCLKTLIPLSFYQTHLSYYLNANFPENLFLNILTLKLSLRDPCVNIQVQTTFSLFF